MSEHDVMVRGMDRKGKKQREKKQGKESIMGIMLHFSLKFHTKEIVLTNHSETSSRKAQTITPNHFLCGRADAHAKHQQYMWMDLVSRKRQDYAPLLVYSINRFVSFDLK